ncbi:MAG TPA: hypothetical protein VJH34_03065 [archaeon]|nr:hypothetical protein [archaeon]
MNFKELIAGLLSVLVTSSTFAFAAMAATTLDQFPGFLATGGKLDAYVVLGSGGTDPAGLASDLAGAVDVALRLAEVQYAKTTAAGGVTGSYTGVQKQIALLQGDVAVVQSTDGLTSPLKNFHFSGLSTGTVSFKGTSYAYHEQVELNSNSANLGLSHGFADSYVNGTETLRAAADSVIYKFVFDENITGLGSYTAPDYSNTLKVKLAGSDIVIVGVNASTTGFKALAGNVGTADSTTPVSYGGYSVYAVDGASTWVKLQIKDASGNLVSTDIVNVNDVKTYTFGTTTFRVKPLSVFASTITNTVSATLAVGPDVDKAYTNAFTLDSKYAHPAAADWYVYGSFAVSGQITRNDFIAVQYHPSATQYLKAGDILKGPNDAFELSYQGYNIASWVTYTITKITGQAAYKSSDTAVSYSNLAGFKIAADVKGSVKPMNISSPDSYDAGYILFNYTSDGVGAGIAQGYWDNVNSRILVDSWDYLNITGGNTTAKLLEFQLSYGGSGGVSKNLNFNLVNNANILVNGVNLTHSDNTKTISWQFKNDTSALGGSSGDPVTFKLGATKSTAEAGDVLLGYGTADLGIGDKTQDVLTDTAVILVNPNSNAAAEQVIIKVPADVLKANVVFGKVGASAVATGGTIYTYAGPIVSPVAMLDKDLTTASKAAKDLVVIGGPCVNSVAADVLGLTYPTCGAASTVTKDTAMIKVVDDKFATGKQVLWIAGWNAADTRLAASVLQNYDQASVSGKLVGKSSVTVSGTSLATATIA